MERCSPDRTVARLRDMLANGGALYDRGVPVRLAFDKQHQGTVAHVMTPEAIVLMAHQVCRPYVLKARRDGTSYEDEAPLPPSCAQMYLGWRGAWQLPRLNGIAAALNARCIRTPAGRCHWHPTQVRRVLKRLVA